MDNATKRSLRQPDTFHALTNEGVQWAGTHRNKVITLAIVAVVAILVIVGGISFYQSRSAAAQTAFGAAMQTYQTPIPSASQPVPPGMKSFPDAKTRAVEANKQFAQVASQYSLMPAGKLAEYFTGLTAMEAGNNGAAEDALKKTAASWNGDIAALGKITLAQLYQQTGRESQAIDLYNELSKSTATTVPAGLAQIQLAELYQSEGKTEQARKIYADLKDKDKNAKGKPGAAAEIATEKLNPTAAPAAQ
jgi:tetratricopeptide (TPR) repeat protein